MPSLGTRLLRERVRGVKRFGLVVDVDQVGTAGGDLANLNPYVRDVVRSLITHSVGPAWVVLTQLTAKPSSFGLLTLSTLTVTVNLRR